MVLLGGYTWEKCELSPEVGKPLFVGLIMTR